MPQYYKLTHRKPIFFFFAKIVAKPPIHGGAAHYLRFSANVCVRILARNKHFFVMKQESQGSEAWNMSKPASEKEVVTDCCTRKTAFWCI